MSCSLHAQAATWDPENLFKGQAPAEGIIERRLMKQRIEKDKEFAAAMLTVQDEDRGKVIACSSMLSFLQLTC